MNILDVMKIPAFENANLIAGKAGGEREVQHVNMMDAPDIADFLHKNELLVTTAYHLKDHPHQLSELIRQMAKRGCAVSALKQSAIWKISRRKSSNLLIHMRFRSLSFRNTSDSAIL